YGRSAFFAGIPGFEDGGEIRVGPVDGEGAPIHQDENCRLAGSANTFEQLLLGSGKVDAGAVPALKSFCADSHFFTLYPRGEPQNNNDEVSASGGLDSFADFVVGEAPDQSRF